MIHQNGKVSVIVPVFNAEESLGYCLNSLLSQTYSNWEAILVNDGSSDNSLKICNNYAKLDSRFRVFTKENGGVSRARNYGLQFVQGEYLEFLDSDDCMDASALKKQVQLARKYDSQLVVMDVLMVDFEKPEESKVLLRSAWLQQSPCCLNREEFREREMRLIWHTALLEGPCAKLYSVALWQKLGLTFPEELSLGEDFVTNLKYFSSCEKVVFLDECGYYYRNNAADQKSLSRKYRDDLFDLKMYFMEKIVSSLGAIETLSAPELDAFYCYGASSGLRCVESMLLRSGKSKDEKKVCLEAMMANELFSLCLKNASYIPERFLVCREMLLNGKLSEASELSEFEEGRSESSADSHAHKSGTVNILIRKGLHFVGNRLPGPSHTRERLLRWENELYQNGIKAFVKARLQKRGAKKQLSQEVIMQQLVQIMDKNMMRQMMALKHEIMQSIQAITEEQARNQAQMMALKHEMMQSIQAITEEQARNQAQMRGNLWDMEQRLSRDRYLWEINDLRQRKKAIMLATAEHQNIGDAAITLAEQQLLSSQFPDYYQVEISTYEFRKKEAYLHAIVNPEDILFLNGGGNLGDVYTEEEKIHQTIIQQFPNNRIIIFPQTIFFKDLTGQIFLNSQRIYNGHKNLTLYLRGSESLRFAQQYFPNVKSFLMPDMVHMLHTEYTFERHGALLCLRDDEEARITAQQRDDLSARVKAVIPEVTYTTNMNTVDITRDIRGLVVRHELMRFAKHQVVITDRLHGMIFSVVTNTPCVVLSSYNQKIPEYYNTFLKDSNLVFFLGNDLSKLENTVEKASHLNVTANTLSQLSNFMWEV